MIASHWKYNYSSFFSQDYNQLTIFFKKKTRGVGLLNKGVHSGN